VLAIYNDSASVTTGAKKFAILNIGDSGTTSFVHRRQVGSKPGIDRQ
jgi:hypothetical protein